MKKKRAIALSLCLMLFVPLAAGAAFPTLRLGDEGAQVRALQQALAGLGFAISADGKYGPMTQSSVRSFQQRQSLKPDGIAGPQTLGALYGQPIVSVNPVVSPAPVISQPPAVQQPVVSGRLELGSSGDQVVNLQQKLRDLGFESGRSDGRFDAATRAALMAFQQASGLKADGIAGPQTLARLFGGYAPGESLEEPPAPSATPAPAPTAAPQQPQASAAHVSTSNGGALRMRTAPDSRQNNVVCAIPNGQALEVLSGLQGWSFVRWAGREGYVMNSFLRFAAPAATPQPTASPSAEPAQPTAAPQQPASAAATVRTANGGSLNLRSEPQTGTRTLIGSIPNGSSLALHSIGNTWCQVSYQGRIGYVMRSFLQIDAPAPQPTATPEPSEAPTEDPIGEPAASPTPLPTDASLFTRILRPGDTGEAVSLLQSRLIKLDYNLNENGVYDDSTSAAVRSFQALNGLKEDGILGPQTAQALMSPAARPSQSAPLTYKALRMGDVDGVDKAVSAMQQRLKELGYTLSVDGSFGVATHDAVVSFQRSNSLSISGVADKLMQSALYAAGAKGPSGGAGGIDISVGKVGGPSASSVRLLDWYTEVKPQIRGGQTTTVYHPASGVSFSIQYYSLGRHADAEPKTLKDTQLMNAAFGRTSWDVRPVYVKLPGGDWTLATMHNYPHLYGSIQDNGFGGHLCIHFKRDLEETQRLDPNYGMQNQRIIRKAWQGMTGEVVE